MSFDTQFTNYQMHKTTRYNMQEDVSLQKHRCDNFKPDNIYTCYWTDTWKMIVAFWNVAQCSPQKKVGL